MNRTTNKEVFGFGKPAAQAGPKAEQPASEKSLLEQARELMKRDNVAESAVTRACEEACGARYGIKPGMKLSEYPMNVIRDIVLGKWEGIKRYLGKKQCQTA